MSFTATESYLIDFHGRRPGATSHCFGAARTEREGQEFSSPYAYLADLVPTRGGPLTVLDLACGDGYLLAEFAARRQPGVSLLGVDMSLANSGRQGSAWAMVQCC